MKKKNSIKLYLGFMMLLMASIIPQTAYARTLKSVEKRMMVQNSNYPYSWGLYIYP